MSTAEAINLTNIELTRVFFAILTLLVATQTVGYVFQRFYLPRVIGEILGGLLLGPSFLGHFFPEIHQWIFAGFETEGKLISFIYWIGLVFLMFISGFEIQKTVSKRDSKISVSIIAGATLIPLIAGWLAPSIYDFTPYIGNKQNFLAMQIVIAIAVAVTSIPVISKIFIDLGIIQTRFSKVVLSAATIQDIILWIALAVATGIVQGEVVSTQSILLNVAITTGFFLCMFFLLPRLMSRIGSSRINIVKRSSNLSYILAICFLFSALASLLNVNIIFGAFLAGVLLGLRSDTDFTTEKEHIKQIGLSFFIPIYFGIVGLKLDLIHHLDISFLVFFLLFSTFFESLGTMIATKSLKLNWLTCLNFSVAMNTRGGPGIVLATVAFDLGIINETFFVTLVLTAIVTSLAAGIWFRYLLLSGKPLMESETLKGSNMQTGQNAA